MKLLFYTSLLLLVATTGASHTEEYGSTLQIHGSGTTNPSKCFWLILEQFADRIKLPVRLTYRAVGSTTSQIEFMGADFSSGNVKSPNNDFGSGDIPFSSAAYKNLTSAEVGIVQLPILLGAISLFHSVPGVAESGGGLNLTSCVIAKIFKREILFWDDDIILELNPNLKQGLPSDNFPIVVGHRVLGSSSTASVTQYLQESCPAEWPTDLVGSVVTWPSSTKACDSSAAMTACIRDFPGTIGYIDSGHGHAENLLEIELRNLDGKYLNSKTASSLGGVISALPKLPASADKDFGDVDLLNNPGANTWPIVAMTYIYVRKDLSFLNNTITEGLLIAFLRALYDPNYISQCVDLFGFTAVPPEVVELGLKGIDMLASNITTEWIFENSSMTIPYDGQEDYVISQKRRSYSELERSDLRADTTAILKEMEMLNALLGEVQAKNVADAQKLQAAFVLGILSIVLWGVVIIGFIFKMTCTPVQPKLEKPLSAGEETSHIA